MTNGVHPLMHAMETPPPHPPIDLGRAQAKPNQLSALYYPVLAPRQLSNCPIRRVLGRFFVHMTNK